MAPSGCFCGNFFSNCNILDVGCYVYTNTSLNPAANAFFSDGTYCYTTNASGYITAKTNCPTCWYADVYIDQTDCDNSDDYTVYCTYNQCAGAGTITIPFPCSSGVGWVYDAFCFDQSANPTFFIYVGGVEQTNVNSYSIYASSCEGGGGGGGEPL